METLSVVSIRELISFLILFSQFNTVVVKILIQNQRYDHIIISVSFNLHTHHRIISFETVFICKDIRKYESPVLIPKPDKSVLSCQPPASFFRFIFHKTFKSVLFQKTVIKIERLSNALFEIFRHCISWAIIP